MAGSVENVYSRALLEIAAEDGSMKELDEELDALSGIFSANPELTEVLCAPTVTDEEKLSLIKTVFEGKISDTALNFLCVLAEKNRCRYLQGIAEEFRNGYYESAGIAEATVTTAVPLKDDARNRLKAKLEKKYGKDGAKERIFATTDKARGTLKNFSDANGYETFVIPDDVGGRFSVLTPVGLLPIAVAGIDIDKLMKGAADARADYSSSDIDKNDSLKYAAIRNILLRKGKSVEILAAYEPAAQLLCEWWKQLFGESEGKDKKGIYPSSVIFSTDLHSLGQFIQDGSRIMFETVLNIKNSSDTVIIPNDPENSDKLNYLAGKELDYVNHTAMLGTLIAHSDGNVPNIVLELQDRSEYSFGYLVYFFELACAVSGYVLGVNPFNQPGVEAYKKNMFALLGKEGYEDLGDKLKKRL